MLSLTNPIWVRSYVSEPELGRIRPGLAVEVLTDERIREVFGVAPELVRLAATPG